VSGLHSALTVGAPGRGRRVEDRLVTSPLDGDSHRVPRPEVFYGQLGLPPDRIRNLVREPEISSHGEWLPHAHHQPRRTPCVAANWVSPGPHRTCRWDTNARQHGCCGPLSASTLSTLQSALSTSADGAPTGCARRPVGRRAHRRDDNRSDGGALGFRTAIPPRPARRYDGVFRLRQHRRGDARGSPWPP
jgi:hypothetical protein